jgi:hypothetical protein
VRNSAIARTTSGIEDEIAYKKYGLSTVYHTGEALVERR